MSQIDKVKEFMAKAGQIANNKPTRLTPEEAILKIRLVMEEAFELAEAAGVKVNIRGDKEGALIEIPFEDVVFSGGLQTEQDVIEIADAIADSLYVQLGAAASWGIDVDRCFDLVHESNMSKFIDGHRDPETQKWIKGPSYTPVDLSFNKAE